MSLTVLIRTAWKALRRNISSSLLTMLGIIIGVGAVIASVAIGAGAQAVGAQTDREPGRQPHHHHPGPSPAAA